MIVQEATLPLLEAPIAFVDMESSILHKLSAPLAQLGNSAMTLLYQAVLIVQLASLPTPRLSPVVLTALLESLEMGLQQVLAWTAPRGIRPQVVLPVVFYVRLGEPCLSMTVCVIEIMSLQWSGPGFLDQALTIPLVSLCLHLERHTMERWLEAKLAQLDILWVDCSIILILEDFTRSATTFPVLCLFQSALLPAIQLLQ
jgi:hypothetical protein